MTMNFTKVNPDELLDGFCRGCLNKYDDPAELLHYTEKSRKLFVYSTGIQVKQNDIFTFQICKYCYFNMKASCKFKKQCRNSERRLKSYLRLKEVGENVDLLTFLRHSEDDHTKFPVLSGNSTPANQKRDDDNESTCASIRNFMTDILQGEDMPDSEARIIKEVIEEEADLLEDSLDSHWLQDDSVDADLRLDFSFSPFVTPRSVNNDHCYTPIRQIEPSLRCKNNHAKKVLLQLPTSRYTNDDPVKIIDSNTTLQNNSFKQKGQSGILGEEMGIKHTTEDSIAELIEQNEEFLIRDDAEVTIKSVALNALEIRSEAEKHAYPTVENEDIENTDLNTFDTEAAAKKKKLPLTENEIAVKSILNDIRNHPKDNSHKYSLSEADIAVKNININAFDSESRRSKDRFDLIETNKAIESIISSDPNIHMGCNYEEEFINPENDAAVKSITISPIAAVKTIPASPAIAVKKHMMSPNPAIKTVTMSPAIADKTIALSPVTATKINSTSPIAFKKNITKDTIIEENQNELSSSKGKERKSVHSHHGEVGYKNSKMKQIFEEITELTDHEEQDPVFVETKIEDDMIDKKIEEALEGHSNDTFSLDDILVSQTEVQTPIPAIATPIKGCATRMSTPTINNILFGEKLDDNSNANDDLKIKLDEEVDPLEEFFKEGVKDFVQKTPDPELPIELKYDLQNGHCKMCDKKFKSMPSLKIHLTRIHYIRFPNKPKKNLAMCNECGKQFDVRYLKKHLQAHAIVKNEIFKCDLCNLTFQAEHKLKMHIKAHDNKTQSFEQNPPVSKRFICTVCGAAFNTYGNMSTHMRRHTENYKHMCDICDKGFYRTSDYEIHNRRRHTGERPFKCIQCGRAFVAKYCLVQHMRTHRADKPFECDYCSSKFPSKPILAYHIKTSKKCIKSRNKSTELKVKVPRFRCPYCPLGFSQKIALVRHQNKSACWDVIKTRFEEPVAVGDAYVEDSPAPIEEIMKPKDLPILTEV